MTNYFNESSKVISSIKSNTEQIDQICKKIRDCFLGGNKILIAGNGGSSSDAQHFAGELTCTYKNPNRMAYPAINLAHNPSAITAWTNDFDHLDFFARQIDAYGKEKDILFLISTGGGDLSKKLSINLIRAANKAIASWSTYCASKSALDSITKVIAKEQHQKLRIVSVSPGVVATNMQEEIRNSNPKNFPLHQNFINYYAPYKFLFFSMV